MPSFIKRYVLSIIIALVILVLSTAALRDLPDLSVKNGDKYGHFIAYFTFVLIALFEHSKSIRWSSRFGRWSIIIAAICIAYGVAMEALQGYVFVYRNLDPADIVANTIGVVVGILFFLIAFDWVKKRMKIV